MNILFPVFICYNPEILGESLDFFFEIHPGVVLLASYPFTEPISRGLISPTSGYRFSDLHTIPSVLLIEMSAVRKVCLSSFW